MGISAIWLLFVSSTCCCCFAIKYDQKLRDVYSWKSLEFAWPNQLARDEAIRTGQFIPGAPLPIDVDVYYGEFAYSCFFFVLQN